MTYSVHEMLDRPEADLSDTRDKVMHALAEQKKNKHRKIAHGNIVEKWERNKRKFNTH